MQVKGQVVLRGDQGGQARQRVHSNRLLKLSKLEASLRSAQLRAQCSCTRASVELWGQGTYLGPKQWGQCAGLPSSQAASQQILSMRVHDLRHYNRIPVFPAACCPQQRAQLPRTQQLWGA